MKLLSMRRKMIGAWQCNYLGFESLIVISQIDKAYQSLIIFRDVNSGVKSEKLEKENNVYKVYKSQTGEYYNITENGILELWDNQGLMTKAICVTPGTDPEPLPMIFTYNIMNADYRYIAGTYSKSNPQYIASDVQGFSMIYHEDINMIFKVDKSTKKIVAFTPGSVASNRNQLMAYIFCAN